MSKRFFDTGIWKRPWFRELTPENKTAWFYILSECDNVGVWIADKKAAEFFVGCEVDWEDLISHCHDNIEVLENGKWWVKDYCKFQHGDLMSRKDSAVVRSYLSLLDEHGLKDRVYKQFTNSCQTVQGKGIGKGRGKGTGKGGMDDEEFSAFWTAYPRKIAKADALKAWKAREKDKTLDTSELMAAVATYTKQMAGKELEYVMHPATFLGPALRWKDYLTTGSKYVPASKASDDLAW
ncbi:MAG: hypothetical protein PHO67_08510, partial [Candidatus Omnitrophica bacterium]|nr:hypothetical protein [Candidatus Omnitrophota bacterium]